MAVVGVVHVEDEAGLEGVAPAAAGVHAEREDIAVGVVGTVDGLTEPVERGVEAAVLVADVHGGIGVGARDPVPGR